MRYDTSDTIAAIASPPGGAVRGIVRISGPAAIDCLSASFRPTDGTSLAGVAKRCVIRGRFDFDDTLRSLPADLYLWPTRQSYTRQPVAELHTIGSPPLLQAALRAICASGVRLAEPGEFTLRAFLAGRLDLTQAEAVLGVIDAEDARQLDVALKQLAGGLARPLVQLRDALADLLADLEAGLDFADEDIDFVNPDEAARRLDAARQTVTHVARQLDTRGESVDRLRAVFVGEPNVGKSSLFNALLGRPAALVADVAGTTRDYLAEEVKLGGIACHLVDTAGMHRRPTEEIEADAGRHGREQRRQSSLEILCLDAGRPMSDWERNELRRRPRTGRLVVLTKIDGERRTDYVGAAIATSSHTGAGVERLRAALAGAIDSATAVEPIAVAATAARCATNLCRAQEALARGSELATAAGAEEIVAAEVRLALDELGQVVGEVYTEDILDRIFSRFCIGK